MNMQSKSARSHFHGADRKLSLVIAFLILCVCAQAVRAKAAYYAARSPQSRYFAASIKIAKFVPLEVAAPQIAAIAVPLCTLQEPRLITMLPSVESISADVAPPAWAVLLRSPPLSS
jgi:hypothetical protein